MSFLDKGINKVLKWESVDASISEILNLIQTEIIEKASLSDLRKLEKGMRKTWVLGVGYGSSTRYYPSSTYPVRLCLQFNILTHQLRQISLQDTINKKEYFIPSGKATCTKLQRAVLHRIAQCTYDEARTHLRRGNGGRFLKQRKRPTIPVWAMCCVVAVVAAVIGTITFFPNPGMSPTDTIVTVQGGYLGEYTDLTVREILDSNYGMLYENSLWDGGTTNSGTVIVQARYYDEGMEDNATTIQFTMLNEECFKITAFVDPLNPIEKATDLLAAMNYNYVLAYVAENRSVVGDPLAEKNFIARLEQISGSAVQYGASAEYGGNRASICEIEGKTPLGVNVAMLLDNYGLLDMSHYWETNVLEQTSPTKSEETEATLPVTEFPETEYNADEMLFSVLKGEHPFIMSDTSEEVSINGIKKVVDNEFDFPLIPMQFTFVDMDQDGQQEAIVELTNNANGWRVILSYQDGAVYGYGYNFRGLQSISIDGLVMGSSGAAYSDVYRLKFDHREVDEEYLSSIESEAALNRWLEISWHDFTDENLSLVASGEMLSFYPLNFANRTTGTVINVLGKNYIFGSGFEGCKLFYYEDNPDICYGFVPNNWENLEITGHEPIVVIVLSGDAQINPCLSADMNKEQLDAVAWDTPDVENVESGSAFSMMSGNIYCYEIETFSATIIYTWYLDDGDSIEYAASEVIIVPK